MTCSRLSSAIAMAGTLVLGGCGDSEKQDRGLRYMPDMYESPAYESGQSQVVTVGQGDAARTHHVPMVLPPVEGTVPRDFVPYQLGPFDWAAARGMVNPAAPAPDVLRRGQERFNVYCAVCHGNDGNAVNGFVTATVAHPNYFANVPSVNAINVATMPDGEIYHLITMGRGRMPNYRAQLPPEDRWAVVLYVKLLARTTMALTNAEDAFTAAQVEVARNPTSALAKEAVAKAQALLADAQRDQRLIASGMANADAFAPKPPAVPEYVRPEWPR